MIKKILGCGIPMFLSGAIAFGYPGVMSSYWQEKFGVGAADTGLVVTFMIMALAVSMFFSGRIHSKVGMKICTIIGTCFYLIAFTVLFFANSIYIVYLWGFLANLGCSFLYGPGLTTGQTANPDKKGIISGILNLMFGTAAAIMAPIFESLLNSIGYTFLNISIMIAFCIIGIIAYILLDSSDRDESKQEKEKNVLTGMTVTEALKTKEFWIIWLSWVFMGAAGISMVSLAKSYTIFLGFSGVTILTAFNLTNGIVRIFAGYCTDKIGGKVTEIAAYLIAGLGYLFMANTGNLIPAVVCAACVGIGFGTLFTATGPMVIDLFGLKNFGMIYGIVFTAYGLIGGIAGPALSGIILEKSNNNYFIVFTYLGIMAVIGMVMMLLLKMKNKSK